MHEPSDKGRTVPGDVCMEVLAARLADADCQQLGYILDGFPHTAAQVQDLPSPVNCMYVALSVLVQACTNLPHKTLPTRIG